MYKWGSTGPWRETSTCTLLWCICSPLWRIGQFWFLIWTLRPVRGSQIEQTLTGTKPLLYVMLWKRKRNIASLVWSDSRDTLHRLLHSTGNWDRSRFSNYGSQVSSSRVFSWCSSCVARKEKMVLLWCAKMFHDDKGWIMVWGSQ